MDKTQILKTHFGYDQFRDGQEILIDTILEGKDVVGIMPTGGGKSICYQIPAMISEGITIVISPLIALMKDQVDGLIANGVTATYLNSTLDEKEASKRIEKIKNNAYKLIYVAPERLLTGGFVSLCRNINIDLIAVDEAHCISQWGHDFRPSYRNIPDFINQLKKRPTLAAFTATATKLVTKEIIEGLGLVTPLELVTGFDRENLLYQVVKPTDKYKYLKQYLKQSFVEGSGIIYCSTRKTVDTLTEKLKKDGVSVEGYHGGMETEKRTVIQERFMLDDTKIIVATNAFGMGIDKPDVRFVIHYNMPQNMEAYYQEAGRAGRDQKKSDCILMYSPSDIVKQKLLISSNAQTEERENILMTNLQKLVNYCHTNECLRNEIINYFGEDNKYIRCDNCGNCLSEVDYIDMTVTSQKVLSCVYRTNQRFGVNVIIQVLRGSKNKKILEWQLDQVSTYGIIDDLSEGGLRELIMHLIARGFLEMTVDAFPVLKLNNKSRDVLKGKEKILLKRASVEIKEKKSKTKKKTDLDIDVDLFEILVSKRRAIAEEKSVPAFVIFPNTALEEMSCYKPVTMEAMLEIKGVGEKKYESYGDLFCGYIKEYIAK